MMPALKTSRSRSLPARPRRGGWALPLAGTLSLLMAVGVTVHPLYGDSNAEVQRALIERQQRADAFALRLQQSQQRRQVPVGDLRARRALDALQLEQRQRMDQLDARQLRQFEAGPRQTVTPGSAAARAWRRQQQRRYERERQRELQRAQREWTQFKHRHFPPGADDKGRTR